MQFGLQRYGTVRCGMVWHGMAWYGMVWHGMAWHGMAWYGMAWYRIVSYREVWYTRQYGMGQFLNCNGSRPPTATSIWANQYLPYRTVQRHGHMGALLHEDLFSFGS